MCAPRVRVLRRRLGKHTQVSSHVTVDAGRDGAVFLPVSQAVRDSSGGKSAGKGTRTACCSPSPFPPQSVSDRRSNHFAAVAASIIPPPVTPVSVEDREERPAGGAEEENEKLLLASHCHPRRRRRSRRRSRRCIADSVFAVKLLLLPLRSFQLQPTLRSSSIFSPRLHPPCVQVSLVIGSRSSHRQEEKETDIPSQRSSRS